MCVGISFFVILLLPTFVMFVEGQIEEEPGLINNMKKMRDVADSCEEKVRIGGNVYDSVKEECLAVLAAFNGNMSKLFHDNKEAIDHILYG